MSKTQKDTLLKRLGGYTEEKAFFEEKTVLEDNNTYTLHANTYQHIAINIARIAEFARIEESQIICKSL